jgi:GNAT superfamily N-acetyltransferase
VKSGYFDAPTRSILSLDYEVDDDRWWIARVSVLTPHRGQGIASRLLDSCLADADAEGITLYLEPIPSDRVRGLTRPQLIRWYESRGFKARDRHIWIRQPRA